MGKESSSGKPDLAVVPRVVVALDPAVGLVGDPTTGNRGADPRAVLVPSRVRRIDARATREANLAADRGASPERANRRRGRGTNLPAGRKEEDPTADRAANREADHRPKNDPNPDPPHPPRGMANEQTRTRLHICDEVFPALSRNKARPCLIYS